MTFSVTAINKSITLSGIEILSLIKIVIITEIIEISCNEIYCQLVGRIIYTVLQKH